MVRSKFQHLSKKNKDSTGFFQKLKNFLFGTELSKRVSTALLMFAFAFAVFSVGFFAVCPVAIILALLMIYEYDRMFIAPLPSDPNIKGRVPSKEALSYFHKKYTFDSVLTAGLLCAFCFNIRSLNIQLFLLCTLAVAFLSIVISLINKRKHWFLESLPSVYIGLGIFCLISLYFRESWFSILFFFVITIATDSGAFFFGRTIGGPKLCPRISPKKTWSGFLGGIFSAVVFVKLLFLVFPMGLDDNKFISEFSSILSVIVLSISAQIGDLFESHLKRTSGVKDSSQFIPGHGGFLDRFDSIIFIFDILSIYYLFKNY